MDSKMAQMQSHSPNGPNAHKLDQTLTASWIESHSLESFLSSPLSQDPHPSLSISNPISLTSSIGLRASPSVPHGLPPWRRLHVRQPPSLSRPSPSTPSPHPSLSISNPNISLTSSIGLRASPSVPHDLPLRLRVILILPLTPNTYLCGCASLCHHLFHFPHCKSYFFLFAYLLLEIVLLWPYNVDCCLKCYIS